MRKTKLSKYCLLLIILFSLQQAAAQSYVPQRQNAKIRVKPSVSIQAFAFDIRDVSLLAEGPFNNAMQKNAAYLLLLDPDRLLHRFYKNAGLPAKGDVYGGWESEGLSGHTLGHYLSACAMQYASTRDERYRKRVKYIVDELERCQAARKTGYVGAIPGEDSIFGKLERGVIKTGGFDLNGGWSPWYTVHKLMAGLLDAYLYCENAKALVIVRKMADWTDRILARLTDEQLQQMLKCEYGGMNDMLANLYAVTGEKKYLTLSYKFYDDFVMKPLSMQIDPLPGKHSNTNVPKAIGSARQYELTGSRSDSTIAAFFWETMVKHHSYVIGGNSNYEYCGEEDKLNDRLSDNTCETCNTYNMLKLTRHLFCWRPTAALGDYYERALYNHILSSQNPETGMMCYFVPLRMGTRKAFSDSFQTFTCCVGSGMENHSKYTEAIYFEGRDGSLFVNLFIPSRLRWKARGITVTQQTKYPEDARTAFTINCARKTRFAFRIRKPWWVKEGWSCRVNDKDYTAKLDEEGFIVVDREWSDKDVLTIHLPMSLYTESMPDNPNRIAFLYGPIVLAGQLGDSIPDPVYGVPVLLTSNKNVQEWMRPRGTAMNFATSGVGQPFDIHLQPFYKTYKNYYSVYWDYFTPEQWERRKEEYESEKRRLQEIEARTIDYFRMGEMQPERDHHLVAGERSYVSDALGVNGREARSGSYFMFDMKLPNNPADADSLLLTYIGDDKNRKFDILVDGKKIATEDWEGGTTGKFYHRMYAIPPELVSGKERISIRIEANYGRTAGRIFGVRLLRK